MLRLPRMRYIIFYKNLETLEANEEALIQFPLSLATFRRYFREFPRPPLRSLHWEVHKYCEPSFSGCVDYLRKRIRYVSLKRVDDTAVVIQEQNWTFSGHNDQIKQIDDECKKLRRLGDNMAEPFEGKVYKNVIISWNGHLILLWKI